MLETILIVLGVLLVVGVIVVASKGRWLTLATARGNQAEELQSKYSYLQSKDIPSRLKSEAVGGAGFAPQGGMAMNAVGSHGGQHEMMKLQVRPKDREQAEEALQEWDRERLLHQSTTL
ncbi:hypothetical protein PA598K_01410 [Paenibacillus sp. 598K]|uniref:hypothetical protein n=1 Tax=Paenibacillus sp. 598K TaxID=1117987 RepID=UPI000FF95E65|nr:hypothetical protein [Paenibacillus sp. 598K]GBF73125.1 hypothetical protein PA598K_01410 [Paenibacillus sp. 598K]